jgi:hypothetical protein
MGNSLALGAVFIINGYTTIPVDLVVAKYYDQEEQSSQQSHENSERCWER